LRYRRIPPTQSFPCRLSLDTFRSTAYPVLLLYDPAAAPRSYSLARTRPRRLMRWLSTRACLKRVSDDEGSEMKDGEMKGEGELNRTIKP
jgi:hypothetical protein